MALLIGVSMLAMLVAIALLIGSARLVEHDARDAHRRSTEALARASRSQQS
jgi:hypothetical protein